MLASRTFAATVVRTTIRPQVILPANIRLASVRARIATMSTVSDAIIKDHRELQNYYNEVVNSSDPDHQTRYGNEFTWELARHSIAEELIVYPAFEKYLGPEGKQIAESDRKEHHKVRTFMDTPDHVLTTADQGTAEKVPELESNTP